jgi:putative pyoverdin transport system ATP-binding/permease protein
MNFFRVILLLARLSRGIQYSKPMVCVIILAGIISGVSNTLLIAVINAALSRAGTPTPQLVWGFAGLCLALALMRFVSGALLLRLTQRAMFGLRTRLCEQILTAPLPLLERLGSHRLLVTLTDDVPSITNAFVTLPLLCMNAAIILGCFVYLWWLSWTLMAGALCFTALGLISHQVPVIKATRHFERAREAMDGVFKHLRGLIEGIKELKLHRRWRETFFSSLLRPSINTMQQEAATGEIIWTAAGSWGQILFFIFIGLILFAVPAWHPTSAAVLTGYTLTVLYLMGPLEYILNALPRLSHADVAIKKIESLSGMLAEQTVSEAARQPGPARPWRALELTGVTHSYRREDGGEEFVMGPLDLCVSPGEVVFITGGNGSGKTTLAKLLVGLYVPQSGEILLDAQPVTDENRDDYRQLFSVVFSDYYLFEHLLGDGDGDGGAKAQEYLARLQLDHRVQIRDGKFSTVELSQGQRKRLALLTAYLENRPIYVFDEWAADQDPQFKDIFYLQLLSGLKAAGKTVFVISHDDRYYHVADRVVKLNYGRIEHDNPVKHLKAGGPAEGCSEFMATT